MHIKKNFYMEYSNELLLYIYWSKLSCAKLKVTKWLTWWNLAKSNTVKFKGFFQVLIKVLSTLLYNRMPQEQLKFALVVIRVMILCKLVWGRSRFPKHCQQDHVYFLFEIHVFLKFYFHSSLHNSLTFRSGNWGGQFIELIWFSLFPLHVSWDVCTGALST